MPGDIDTLVERADKQLQRLENGQLATIERVYRRALAELEDQVARGFEAASQEAADIQDAARRKARAQLLIANVQAQLATFELLADQGPGAAVSDALHETIRNAHQYGIDNARRELRAYEPGIPLQGEPDWDAVEAATRNSSERLKNYGVDFQDEAKQAIASGILQGKPLGQVRDQLRERTGVLLSKAERVVRTESITAHDEGRKVGYRENDIQYVQRSSAQDSKVCQFCAARHGKVYPIDEAPIALHPHDRCANLPWRPEWVEAGIVDMAEWDAERKAAVERAGGDPDPGPAPFEVLNAKRGKPKIAPEVDWRKLAQPRQLIQDAIDSDDPNVLRSRMERIQELIKTTGEKRGPGRVKRLQAEYDAIKAKLEGLTGAVTPPPPPPPKPVPPPPPVETEEERKKRLRKERRERRKAKAAVEPEVVPPEPKPKTVATTGSKQLTAEEAIAVIRRLKREDPTIFERAKGATKLNDDIMLAMTLGDFAEVRRLRRIFGAEDTTLEQRHAAQFAIIEALFPNHEDSKVEYEIEGAGRTVVTKTIKDRVAHVVSLFEHVVGDDRIATNAGVSTVFRVMPAGQRGYYDNLRGEIYIANDASERTILHEMGHWFEDIDAAQMASKLTHDFLRRRTHNGKDELVRYQGRASELMQPDKFYDPYVGIVYGDKNIDFRVATEVLSMSIQQFAENLEDLLNKDPEHFKVLWEILTTTETVEF